MFYIMHIVLTTVQSAQVCSNASLSQCTLGLLYYMLKSLQAVAYSQRNETIDLSGSMTNCTLVCLLPRPAIYLSTQFSVSFPALWCLQVHAESATPNPTDPKHLRICANLTTHPGWGGSHVHTRAHPCLRQKVKGRTLAIAPHSRHGHLRWAQVYMARTKQRRTYLPYTFPAVAGTHLPTPRVWRFE